MTQQQQPANPTANGGNPGMPDPSAGTSTPPGGSPNNSVTPDVLLEEDPAAPGMLQPSGPQECGAESYMAEPKTLEMYVLFDDSGSWGEEDWTAARNAVKGFVDDVASEGIGVALSFFRSECDSQLFLTPQVDMALLPTHRAELGMALDGAQRNGETITQAALAGGIEFARNRLAGGVNSKIVMLLVTDGEPDESDCASVAEMANDIPAVAQTAAEGLMGPNAISTYVLAVAGGQQYAEGLDSIAVAGGTEKAITADPATLATVFGEIRMQELASLPCEYDLPAEYEQVRDPNLVNLTFGGVTLSRVPSEADCDQATGGWYYDDAVNPTRLIACGSTCEQFRAAGSGSAVDIKLGCPTLEGAH